VKRRQLEPSVPTFDLADAFDTLREINRKTDAFVTAAERQLERCSLCVDGDVEFEDGERPVENLAHLMGAAKEAARAAVYAGNHIADQLAKHRTGV
jgi:hypothetical protein